MCQPGGLCEAPRAHRRQRVCLSSSQRQPLPGIPRHEGSETLGSKCFLPQLAPSQALPGHAQVKPIVWLSPRPPVPSQEQAPGENAKTQILSVTRFCGPKCIYHHCKQLNIEIIGKQVSLNLLGSRHKTVTDTRHAVCARCNLSTWPDFTPFIPTEVFLL